MSKYEKYIEAIGDANKIIPSLEDPNGIPIAIVGYNGDVIIYHNNRANVATVSSEDVKLLATWFKENF